MFPSSKAACGSKPHPTYWQIAKLGLYLLIVSEIREKQVVCAIIVENEKILISMRPSHVHLGNYWEFPGGKVEENESHHAALKREIKEEVGLEIDIETCLRSISHVYESEEKKLGLHFFLCKRKGGEPVAKEVKAVQWVSPNDLKLFRFPAADEEMIRDLPKMLKDLAR